MIAEAVRVNKWVSERSHGDGRAWILPNPATLLKHISHLCLKKKAATSCHVQQQDCSLLPWVFLFPLSFMTKSNNGSSAMQHSRDTVCSCPELYIYYYPLKINGKIKRIKET